MSGLTAVVAENKERANLIASKYGVDPRWAFSAQNPAAFEGLRADLVLIDSASEIPAEVMHTIHATTLKMPGGGHISYVTA